MPLSLLDHVLVQLPDGWRVVTQLITRRDRQRAVVNQFCDEMNVSIEVATAEAMRSLTENASALCA